MDDPQPTDRPLKKTARSAKPRTPRAPGRSNTRTAAARFDEASEPDAGDSPRATTETGHPPPNAGSSPPAAADANTPVDAPRPHAADAETQTAKNSHSGRRPKTLGRAIVDFAISSIVILAVSALLESIAAVSPVVKQHLKAADSSAIVSLSYLDPKAVASNFYGRLIQQHGFALYQWSAPFNADMARERLVSAEEQRYPRLMLNSAGQVVPNLFAALATHVPSDLSPGAAEALAPLSTPTPQHLDVPVEAHPIRISPGAIEFRATSDALLRSFATIGRTVSTTAGTPTAAEPTVDTEAEQAQQDARDTAAFSADLRQGLAQIDRYTVGNSANIISMVLGLPDAYIWMIRNLAPHGSPIVQICAAALIFALARAVWLKLDDTKEGWGLLMVLVYLPLVASLTEWILQKAALSTAVELGRLLSAPALAVTASLGISPYCVWAAGKLTEHHLFEFAHQGARRVLFQEAGEE